MVLRALAFLLYTLAAPAAVSSRILHVTADGRSQYPTIQSALDASAPGDTVSLAPGIYTWTAQGSAGLNMLVGRPGVSIMGRGGFEDTIIDAEYRGRALLCLNVGDMVIANLTIRHGQASSVHLGEFFFGTGAGIAADMDSRPVISRCLIEENRCDCIDSKGGAIVLVDGKVVDSIIRSNRGGFDSVGAGIAGLRTLVLERCVIRDHVVAGDNNSSGAGAWVKYGVIVGCTFQANYLTGIYSASGGGLTLLGGTVSDCLFLDNTVNVQRGAGSLETPLGGGVFCRETTVTNCVFWNNHAIGGFFPGFGAGLAGVGTVAQRVVGCTFVGNDATTEAGPPPLQYPEVAGVWLTAGTVERCVFAENSGWCIAGGAQTSCCCFWNNTPAGSTGRGMDAEGNFEADPEFCVTPGATPDARIRASSPCANGQHPEGADCGQIGAGVAGCAPTPVHPVTFGAFKRRFR